MPSGVAATPAVHYEYDSAGNRTLMNDGLGSVNYAYDTLSQLLSETRYFTELGQTFKLTYDYNYGGQVARVGYESLSHPGDNSQVDYAYDQAGALSAITGSPFAGVTQYATGMKYRGWGGLRSLSYGNDVAFSAAYNVNLQLQSLNLTKSGGAVWMNKTYQYHADGRIKFAGDALDNRFDRAFSYDQVGRLQEAWTGSQARDYVNQVPIGPAVVPYHSAYQYDVWGNRLANTGKVWSLEVNQTPATYQNLRRDGWQYDAAGHVISEGTGQFQYDAAGRNVSITQGSPPLESVQAYDGDGVAVRRDTTTTQPVFYLRSLVLGGKVVAEINGMEPGVIWTIPRGGKLRSYVHGGEVRVATQEVVASSPPTQQLDWLHLDPVTGTKITPCGSGLACKEAEPDPQGIHVGLNDPGQVPPPPPDPEEPSYLGGGGSWNSSYVTYYWHGLRLFEAFMLEAISSNATVVAPAEEVITIIRDGKPTLARWQAYADGYAGYVPIGKKYLGEGGIEQSRRSGRPAMKRISPGAPRDTDLGKINGATGGSDEMGRIIDFGGLAFQQKPQPQNPEPPRPTGDCARFADMVEQIANETIGSRQDYPGADVQQFMNRLATTFTEFSAARLGAVVGAGTIEPVNTGQQRFGSSGFASSYFEPDANQVRHAVGGLIAGYVGISLARMNARENPRDPIHGVPDINLNGQTVPMGARLGATGYSAIALNRRGISTGAEAARGLANWIRNTLCGN